MEYQAKEIERNIISDGSGNRNLAGVVGFFFS